MFRGNLRINTAVVLRVVCDLGPSTPNNLAAGSDHAQFTDVDLDDGSLGQDAELGVHGGLRVLLDAQKRELDGDSEFRVGDVGFLVAQSHRPDEALVLDGPSGEVTTD